MEQRILLFAAVSAIILSIRKIILNKEYEDIRAILKNNIKDFKRIQRYWKEKWELNKVPRTLKEAFQKSKNAEPINVINPSGIIVFDVETTGLSPEIDEIIQISIIDGDGNCLINDYVRPYHKKKWPDAEKINNISPEMVAQEKFPHEIIPLVKGIFESANTWIAYNDTFDLSMLRTWGIIPSESVQRKDVMLMFAKLSGEWDEKRNHFRYSKLKDAAKYFNYEFKAHDSLEDVKATLYCYRQMQGFSLTGANIKEKRIQKGIKAEEMAERLGIGEFEYVGIEDVIHNHLSLNEKIISKIASALEITKEELVETV